MVEPINFDAQQSAPNPYEFFDDPLSLSTSDQPSLQLVTYLFNGNNFLQWKRDAFMALVSKNKAGFIDGTCKKPEKSDKKYNQWIRCGLLVMRWILNSIEKRIRESLHYVQSSKDLWSEILDRYGQTNGVEIYQLKKELRTITQSNQSLIEYYSCLKRAWESLDALDPIPVCSCNAIDLCNCQLLKKIVDRDANAKLIQLLMGLNSSYEGIKTTILSMDPLPPLNKALALLQKIERQKQVSDAVDVLTEANAFASLSDSRQSDVKKQTLEGSLNDSDVVICNYCHHPGHIKANCYKLRQSSYCGRKGHAKESCFQLRGNTGQKHYRGRGIRRGANHADVVGYRDTYATRDLSDPLTEHVADDTPSAGTHAVLDQGLLDGLVNTVMDKVLQAINDKSIPSNPAMSSVNFAGPFK